MTKNSYDEIIHLKNINKTCLCKVKMFIKLHVNSIGIYTYILNVKFWKFIEFEPISPKRG